MVVLTCVGVAPASNTKEMAFANVLALVFVSSTSQLDVPPWECRQVSVNCQQFLELLHNRNEFQAENKGERHKTALPSSYRMTAVLNKTFQTKLSLIARVKE